MKEIKNDSSLVANCGLYCGACSVYLKGKCPGCRENVKATWCKLRSCCMKNSYTSCADCKSFKDVNDCRYFNNLLSKFFSLIFRSDRKACIEQIRKSGIEKHAEMLALSKSPSVKRQ